MSFSWEGSISDRMRRCSAMVSSLGSVWTRKEGVWTREEEVWTREEETGPGCGLVKKRVWTREEGDVDS